MGVDIFGRKPCSPDGEYFTVNFTGWGPIHSLIVELCSDLLDEEMLDEIGGNSGFGPHDQKTCTQMASRFEMWMEDNVDGLSIDLGQRVDKDYRLISAEAAMLGLETKPAYKVSDKTLKKWIDFLRSCGGFEVW